MWNKKHVFNNIINFIECFKQSSYYKISLNDTWAKISEPLKYNDLHEDNRDWRDKLNENREEFEYLYKNRIKMGDTVLQIDGPMK